jgi:hypothetical protein
VFTFTFFSSDFAPLYNYRILQYLSLMIRMLFVVPFSIFLSYFQSVSNQSQQPSSIIDIRTGCDHILWLLFSRLL